MLPFDSQPRPENHSAQTLLKLARITAIVGVALIVLVVASFAIWAVSALVSCPGPDSCLGDIVLWGFVSVVVLVVVFGGLVLFFFLTSRAFKHAEIIHNKPHEFTFPDSSSMSLQDENESPFETL